MSQTDPTGAHPDPAAAHHPVAHAHAHGAHAGHHAHTAPHAPGHHHSPVARPEPRASTLQRSALQRLVGVAIALGVLWVLLAYTLAGDA
jgi:hypothetical protein